MARTSTVRFVAVFIVVLVALFTAELTRPIQSAVVLPWTDALARISVEFVRVPDVQLGYFAGDWLTMGQILSFPMLLAGIALLVLARRWQQSSGNFKAAA